MQVSDESYLVELDNIRVADFLENFDLSSDPLHILLVIDLLLLEDLDGNLRRNKAKGSD